MLFHSSLFPRVSRPPPTRRARLALHPLETRDVPAGTVTAQVAHGVLVLTGDDRANAVKVLVTANSVVLTPDPGASGTTIDDLAVSGGGTPGAAVTLPNVAVTALRADLRGGDDSLTADPGSPLTLPGGADVRLGDGANTLDLSTSQKIDLGRLAVRAGDGADTVKVVGGAGKGSRVAGPATIESGIGTSATTLKEVQFLGPDGLRVADAASGGSSTLTATNVNVTRTVRAAFGSDGTASFTGGALGGVTAGGLSVGVTLASLTVGGPVSVRGGRTAQFTASENVTLGSLSAIGGQLIQVSASGGTFAAGAVAGSVGGGGVIQTYFSGPATVGPVSLQGGDVVQFSATGATIASGAVSVQPAGVIQTSLSGSSVVGPLSAHGGDVIQLSFSGSSVGGPLSVHSNEIIQMTFSGTSSVGPVSVGAADLVQLSTGGTFVSRDMDVRAAAVQWGASGTSAKVNGSLTISGSQSTATTFGTTALSEVSGPVRVTGGPQADTFTTNQHFQADRDVTLHLGGGKNTVAIGNGTPSVALKGPLEVTTGDGDDAVTLKGVEVFKGTTIRTGAGKDTLTIDLGVRFDGTFLADVGGGDDTIAIAQDAAAAAVVEFVGPATFLAGDGNDILKLGTSAGANSTAVFDDPMSRLDGGAGYNTFDGLTPGQAPSKYTGLAALNLIHWTDPNP